ncbi:hypothetical protein [Deinococcus ficus]|uniref:Uncharacterized protein n=1 Tax=Deinococcus ficus TaxID=317577 RepID=A0A221T331_9DEIO|nr:hypothetical protein [Deinococcus ficus]ASN83270.1 hypothetical protein DFI_18910 [Deinococcus ficus]
MSFTTKLLLAVVLAAFVIVAGVFATNATAVLSCMAVTLVLFGVTVNDKRLIDYVISAFRSSSK